MNTWEKVSVAQGAGIWDPPQNFSYCSLAEEKEGPATHAEGTVHAKARSRKERGADWRLEEGAEEAVGQEKPDRTGPW